MASKFYMPPKTTLELINQLRKMDKITATVYSKISEVELSIPNLFLKYNLHNSAS